MSDKTNEGKVIRLRWAGEIPDYYRTYYTDEATGDFYALMNFRSVRTWYTTACNGEEPDMPLKNGLHIEIIAGGQVISREVISRVDDCTSIGLPVIESQPDTADQPRRGSGKKAAAPAPDQTGDGQEVTP
jgi:hypothetical protein